MKTTTVLLLLALSALALADTKASVTMGPAANTNDPSKTTANSTSKPTTKPITKAPTTTATTKAPTTTTTTKAPTTTTTTKAPTTTTTTKAPTTTTTTKAPTTTTTTTMPPTKPPTPTNSTVGNYTVDKGTQRCLMIQMELRVRVASKQANGTFLLLPNMTSTSGSCDDTQATINLLSKDLNLTMSFSKNLTLKTTFVSRLAFNLTHDFGKKAVNEATTFKVDNTSVKLFSAKTGKSYSCRKESLFMGSGIHLDITQDRMQAFNFSKSNDFGTTDPCPADQNNYRVAIAVGITLLVLVVVVVVAYLLARRKRSDGYQSL